GLLSFLSPSVFWARGSFSSRGLRCVGGQRRGRERPVYAPYPARAGGRGATKDIGGPRPGGGGEPSKNPADTSEPGERWKGIAETGSAMAAGLDSIAREDKTFDAK